MTDKVRVALVSGGTRGLGRASARRLLGDGARVHVAGRAVPPDVAAEFPGRAHRADANDARALAALVESVVARDGRLDVLVHAVGDFGEGPLAETGPHDLRALWDSNVGTALRVVDAARPALRSARGCAVFFGTAGLARGRGRRRTAGYAASKAALRVLVRSLALEEAPFGVRVNLVSPGLVPHEDSPGGAVRPDLVERVPLGRAGRPEDVAAAVAWLASDAAGYVTGIDLAVDGGWLL